MLTRPPLAASTQRQPQQRSLSHGLNVDTHNARAHGANGNLSRPDRSATAPYSGAQQESSAGQRRNVSMLELTTDFDINIEDARPRKRARIQSDTDMVASPQACTQHGDALHETVPGEALGLPMRPVEPLKRHGSRRSTGENAARRADGLTPPAMATQLPPPKTVADFSPWHGQHAEDILNEQVIKSGYSEKTPSPNQNESNTARMTIWPNLSQKSNVALHTLSLLYTQVLEKRQLLGRCTAPSSFKPPPRVTVTDTKREAWLRDLANPSVPLRRQSRTIPHGIRGKLLLEQCVAKSVPLPRAVWLAKCVGANELRAFKRKGVGGTAAAQGEAKWVRDWTLSVEQYLAETISTGGQQGWRAKIEYAVRLVTTIYTENLLERDHFLDWIVSSLSASSLDQAPSWLLLSQLYWSDLVGFSRRGRLLAKALLKHLHTTTNSDQAIFNILREHLCKQITALVAIAQDCLVLPDVWRTYRDLIKDVALKDPRAASAFSRIDARNERLLETSMGALAAYCHPSVRLFEVLDQVSLDVDIHKLTQRCIDITPDVYELVTGLLSWASTKYRSGNARITIAEQIIVKLHQHELDTDLAVLTFISVEHESSSTDSDNVYAVITGLLKHNSFSPGRYLKWLITSGAMSANKSMTLARGLLLHLPAACLPQHLSNTRTSLLSRLHEVDLSAIQSSTERLRSGIQACLADASMPLRLKDLFLQHPCASKSDLADWSYHYLANASKENIITLHVFCIFRSIFEECGCPDGLLSLVDLALAADDFLLLGSISDTVNMHACEFAVLSKLSPLLDRLAERYRTIRTQQPLERTSVIAAKNLFSRIPDRSSFVKLLKNDLIIYERQNLSAVCSPASDNLIGMQAGKIDTDDEIEAVFASGNTMDESLMQRVFLRIMQRTEKTTEVTTNPSPPCRWLTHLRSLDQSTFETIVTNYLASFLSNPSQHTLPCGVYMLIAADCYSIESILSFLKDNSPAGSIYAVLRLLAAPLESGPSLSDPERYHLEQQRSQYCQDHPQQVKALLCRASTVLHLSVNLEWILDLVTMLGTAELMSWRLGQLWGAILTTLEQDVHGLTVERVVAGANALNVGICAAWLSSQGDADSGSTRAALIGAVIADSPVWPVLIQACSRATVSQIHAWALEVLLREGNTMPEQKHIDVFDVTRALLKQSIDQSLLSTIATRLKAISKSLSTSGDVKDPTVKQIKVLLHVITSCSPEWTEDVYTQGRAHIVVALLSLLSLPGIEADAELCEHISDVAGTLIDRLPCEVITRLSRSPHINGLNQKTTTSCLGTTTPQDAWLSLATAAHSTASLQSRALLKPGIAVPGLQTAARHAQLSGGQQLSTKPSTARPGQQNVDLKYTPYTLRRWEVMPDPTPVIGENDSSISLALFGARRA